MSRIAAALLAVLVPLDWLAAQQSRQTTAQDTACCVSRADAGPGDTTRQSGRGLYARHPWLPRFLGAQFTYIWQDLPPFHAAYRGTNSLISTGDNEGTHTYGAYVGSRMTDRLQVYVDFEMARGSGVSHAAGLAGLTDGDVIRQGSVDLGQGPYLARAYARYMIPLAVARDTADRAEDQVPGSEPATRIEIKAGKWALNDDLDLNRYAGTTRYEFMDWALWQNTAWDFAADTRGYTNAVMLGFVSPRLAIKFAAAQMPTVANGNVFDGDIRHAYALNTELAFRPSPNGPAFRFLAYDNRARMGSYRGAIDIARAMGSVPDIVATDRRGRAKYGFGFNYEQPLADSGNTGVFLRLGWNDGATEDFVFTEVDRVISGGVQLAGDAWHRPRDRFGLGAVVDGISKDHTAYLAAGGVGFLLGDGHLSYGTEDIVEAYYRLQLPYVQFAQITPAIQHTVNPGYNTARGPVNIYTIRVNLHY